MLQNAYFLAKIGADTAENEQHFAKILPKTGNYPTGPPGRLAVPGAPRFLLGPGPRVKTLGGSFHRGARAQKQTFMSVHFHRSGNEHLSVPKK